MNWRHSTVIVLMEHCDSRVESYCDIAFMKCPFRIAGPASFGELGRDVFASLHRPREQGEIDVTLCEVRCSNREQKLNSASLHDITYWSTSVYTFHVRTPVCRLTKLGLWHIQELHGLCISLAISPGMLYSPFLRASVVSC
jgi:hypothetical protein